MGGTELGSWRDGPAKRAIEGFVARVCGADGSEPVAVEERLAVFDNDGTLWCEKADADSARLHPSPAR